MKKLLISLIEFYQMFLSFDRGVLSYFAPGGACKFSLSCSQYTKEAMQRYGLLTGMKLALARIWSCR